MPEFTDAPRGGEGEGARALLPPSPAVLPDRVVAALTSPPERRIAFDTAAATPCQRRAFFLLRDFFASPTRRAFLLSGAAGTGKTWTTSEVVRALLEAGYDVVVAATTNKAARVLRANARRATCPRARAVFERTITVARLLHRKRMLTRECKPSAAEQRDLGLAPDATVERRYFVPLEHTAADNTVVIIDEVSMLSPTDAALAVQRFPRVIFVGDRYQLPPVGVPGWLEHQTPDAELVEIVRQAKGSGIARLGQDIRRCRHADGVVAGPLNYGDEVLDLRPCGPWDDFFAEHGGLDGIDVILAHRNDTCGRANVAAVQARFPGWKAGDAPPVGALLYSHEAFVVPEKGGPKVLVGKGCTLRVQEVRGAVRHGPYEGWTMRLHNLDEGREVVVPCLAATFSSLGYQRTARKLGALTHGMAEIGFGYALTVHKSQGSEWENVLLIDEFGRRTGQEFRKWSYTGVTRAKRLLVYARPR